MRSFDQPRTAAYTKKYSQPLLCVLCVSVRPLYQLLKSSLVDTKKLSPFPD